MCFESQNTSISQTNTHPKATGGPDELWINNPIIHESYPISIDIQKIKLELCFQDNRWVVNAASEEGRTLAIAKYLLWTPRIIINHVASCLYDGFMRLYFLSRPTQVAVKSQISNLLVSWKHAA